jgi:hypothetical protein
MSDTQPKSPLECGGAEDKHGRLWCALRKGHQGPHRDWREVADEREELLEALARICARAVASHEESSGIMFSRVPAALLEQARAAIARAEGREG